MNTEILWNHDEPIHQYDSIGAIYIPPYIDRDITPATVAAIVQGGCDSGAYMPAVTYHEAMDTMQQHGDDVLDDLDGALGEIPLPPDGIRSWAGLACYFVSVAVELWASSIEEELADLLEELADREEE